MFLASEIWQAEKSKTCQRCWFVSILKLNLLRSHRIVPFHESVNLKFYAWAEFSDIFFDFGPFFWIFVIRHFRYVLSITLHRDIRIQFPHFYRHHFSSTSQMKLYTEVGELFYWEIIQCVPPYQSFDSSKCLKSANTLGLINFSLQFPGIRLHIFFQSKSQSINMFWKWKNSLENSSTFSHQNPDSRTISRKVIDDDLSRGSDSSFPKITGFFSTSKSQSKTFHASWKNWLENCCFFALDSWRSKISITHYYFWFLSILKTRFSALLQTCTFVSSCQRTVATCRVVSCWNFCSCVLRIGILTVGNLKKMKMILTFLGNHTQFFP